MRFAVLIATLTLLAADARADMPRLFGPDAVTKLNRTLAGKLHDFTNNHGTDRRLFSPALDEKRDLYAYTPPGYDGTTQFPFMLFLHGLGQDEKIFLEVVGHFDAAIKAGTAPRMVIVAPDGSVHQRPSLVHSGSFYVNSAAGNFGDFIAQDVWNFAHKTYQLRPEREAHAIMGASMGGFGAYNVAFKNKDQYAHVVGIMPPLNMRYGDAKGRYLTDYDPDNFALRPVNRRFEVIGQFYGLLMIRSRRVLDPLVGRWAQDATAFVSRENPFEMLTSRNIQPGEFNLFVGYGTKDEFNVDAAAASFVDEANRRGVAVDTLVLPDGRHNITTAVEMVPVVNRWLLERLGPSSPEGVPTDLPPIDATPTTTRRVLRFRR
jgi:S-formylglutathione hydrolase FrmB